MTPPVERLGAERGVALILTLVVLMTLSALALAALTMSALEPKISRNLYDAARARWLAEAGIELGYSLLALAVSDGTWSALLAQTPPDTWAELPSLHRVVFPGLGPTDGTCTVSIRKDPKTQDGVILRSTGTVNTVTRTIEAAVSRVSSGPESNSAPPLVQIADWREF